MAIATAVQAQFIRVNVHGGAVVSEQGIIEGVGHLTTRLRSNLRSNVLILADVGVKHAAPLVDRGLATETKDLTERGLVDAIIVSGERTGSETSASDVELVRRNTALPVLIGSGATPDNIVKIYDKVDGFIVGSYLKSDGKGEKFVDPQRVTMFMQALKRCAEVAGNKSGRIA
jgi:membrane complex biogenesis BtpA family protein